jgi:hypothetical protein
VEGKEDEAAIVGGLVISQKAVGLLDVAYWALSGGPGMSAIALLFCGQSGHDADITKATFMDPKQTK